MSSPVLHVDVLRHPHTSSLPAARGVSAGVVGEHASWLAVACHAPQESRDLSWTPATHALHSSWGMCEEKPRNLAPQPMMQWRCPLAGLLTHTVRARLSCLSPYSSMSQAPGAGFFHVWGNDPALCGATFWGTMGSYGVGEERETLSRCQTLHLGILDQETGIAGTVSSIFIGMLSLLRTPTVLSCWFHILFPQFPCPIKVLTTTCSPCSMSPILSVQHRAAQSYPRS